MSIERITKEIAEQFLEDEDSVNLSDARSIDDDAAEVLVQNTLTAISRLAKKEVISQQEKNTFYKSYKYMRKIQTFLRLNEEEVVVEGNVSAKLIANLMKHKSQREFLQRLGKIREGILAAIKEI